MYSEIYDQTSWKIYVKEFFCDATDNSPKILLKMNSFKNTFQGFQTTDFKQVNAQWVEGSIILVGNDVLPR